MRSTKWIIILCFLGLGACGQNNLLSGTEKEDPQEKAAIALDEQRPDDAIKVLNAALVDAPKDARLLSLLSAAIAQKYGVDPVELALKMGVKSAEEVTGNAPANSVTALYSVVPDATDETIAGLAQAVDILNGISLDERTPGDQFKLAMLQTALITLRTKKFDRNGDGALTADELNTLTEGDASAILANLESAISAMTQGIEGANAEKVAEALDDIKTKIASQPGATDAERLKNFLASQGY